MYPEYMKKARRRDTVGSDARTVLPSQNKHNTQARGIASSSAISPIFNVAPKTKQNETKRTKRTKKKHRTPKKRSDVGDDLHGHAHCEDLLGALYICGCCRVNVVSTRFTSTAGFTETLSSPVIPRATCRAIQCRAFT